MAAIAALPSLFPHERPLGAPTQAMPALKMRPKSLHRFFSSFLQFDRALVNLLSNIPMRFNLLIRSGISRHPKRGLFRWRSSRTTHFYAYLIFFFFHVVDVLNYAMFSADNGNFLLHWTYSNNKLLFNMTCKASGWCAVGFTENPGGGGMVNYDIAAGGVSANNTSYLEVSFYNVTGCTFR